MNRTLFTGLAVNLPEGRTILIRSCKGEWNGGHYRVWNETCGPWEEGVGET
ncbi:hypothetical protein [Streptomyces sp. HD]|uniref:hypothetical protein n=1 Tax=Streptomyces sp. HD TaxID=3020892 RepID=UPI00232C1A3B|nr:hypothetical protein [Streptomyces sp. HD]MDC0765339.1 hypothetical protein [Streptomyces sp. HD]